MEKLSSPFKFGLPRRWYKIVFSYAPSMITTLAATLLCLGFVVNVYHLNLLLIHHDPSASREFSFVGDDYPQRLPLEVPEVKMVIEDSLRYPMSGPTADEQWLSLFPHGHFVHLGPQNISFALTMYHQLHCLDTIRRDIARGNAFGHSKHCLNYLRQMILCEGNTYMEPVIPERGPKAVNSEGEQVRCRDWSVVFDYVERGNAGR